MSVFASWSKSVQHAWRGLRVCFVSERNFRIQVACGLCVYMVTWLWPFTTGQRLLAWFVVAFVLVLELINTAIERVVDLLKPRLHECAREIKDLMAAAVFVGAVFAGMVGFILFLPVILLLLRTV